MTKVEREYIRDIVGKEGFDSAFFDYSDFENVKDEEFHRLRKAYLAAREALEEYFG